MQKKKTNTAPLNLLLQKKNKNTTINCANKKGKQKHHH
jgi:hypothetical protein